MRCPKSGTPFPDTGKDKEVCPVCGRLVGYRMGMLIVWATHKVSMK